jgi:hypothetical protein
MSRALTTEQLVQLRDISRQITAVISGSASGVQE